MSYVSHGTRVKQVYAPVTSYFEQQTSKHDIDLDR